jgi:Na+/H+ antiporter NhaA
MSSEITRVVRIVILQPRLLRFKVKVRHICHFVICAGVVLQKQALRSVVFQTDALVIVVFQIPNRPWGPGISPAYPKNIEEPICKRPKEDP